MESRFVKAYNLEEALKYTSSSDSKIIAGGTDFIVNLRKNKDIDKTIVDISSVKDIKSIGMNNGVISIGAGCTHSDIEKNEIVKKYIPILARGCSFVGSTLIRNRGTIGGNIVNNSNCADSVPALLILDASMIIQSLNKRRTVKLQDFFKDKESLDIRDGEIVTSIEIKPFNGYKWDMIKVGRRKSLSISRLTLAVAVKIETAIFKDLRLCCGAVLPKHQRLNTVENRFTGSQVSYEILESIGDMVSNEVLYIDGKRWSSEYKIPVLKKLIIRTLEQLVIV